MKDILTFFLIGSIALIEGLLPTIVIARGVLVPLTLIVLSWAMSWTKSSRWPWLGLVAGLLLDLSTLNPFGTMSIFYTAIMYGLYLIEPGRHARENWGWIKILIIGVAAFVYPWYLLLVNGRFALASAEVAVTATQLLVISLLASSVPMGIKILKQVK